MKKISTLSENVSFTRDESPLSNGLHRFRLPFKMRLHLLTSYSASLQAMRGQTGSQFFLTLN